jgi:hypothetical protein
MGSAGNLQVHFSQNLHCILDSIYDGRIVLSSWFFYMFKPNGTTTNTPKFSCVALLRFSNSAISQYTCSVQLYFTWIKGYIVNMSGFHVLYVRQTAEFLSVGARWAIYQTYQKNLYEFISNLIHLSFVVELTYLIAGNGHFLKIDHWYVFTWH